MFQDLRFAFRLLFKDRTFTATAVLTLVLCIGANTAILSIVRSVLLKPLPIAGADRLMYVYNSYPGSGATEDGAGVPDYFDRLKAVPALDALALYRRVPLAFGTTGAADRLVGVRATPSFYRLVGATPQLGRLFTDDEGQYGNHHVVILSDGFWRRALGADPGIVGKEVTMSGSVYPVVGVMSRSFNYLWNDVDVWVPEAFSDAQKADDQRHFNSWEEVGRLKRTATVQQAQSQIDAINAQTDIRFPESREFLREAGFRTIVMPLQDFVVRDIKGVLYLLWGGVLCVLLLGGVNITNLVLTRSAGRTRELATRHAIGADRQRLARQLLTETTVMSVVGGALGLVAGWWALGGIKALRLGEIPRADEITLDPVTAGVVLAIAVAVGLVVGLVPLMRLARLDVNSALSAGGRGGTGGRGTNMLRKGLATAQVALAFVLLVGAGLLAVSFREVLRIDPGFDASGVVTATASLPTKGYRNDSNIVEYTNQALAAIRALPGVESAGSTNCIPFGGKYNDGDPAYPVGYHTRKGDSAILPYFSQVSDGYVETMRMKLARGRSFDTGDTDMSTRVVIIDEPLADRFFPGLDPIGRILLKSNGDKPPKRLTVVGVVKPVRLTGMVEKDARAGSYYYPHSQFASHTQVFAVRVRGNPEAMINPIRKAIAAIDPLVPVDQVRTMQDRVDSSLVTRRVPMLLSMGFGVIALFLSAIGVYGVLAYGVTQRRREIAVRLALGSTPGGVFRLMLRDGGVILGLGLLAGLGTAWGAGRMMTSHLYEVQPMDPLVLATVSLTLAVVAFVATAIPARRAARVNPNVVLNDQ